MTNYWNVRVKSFGSATAKILYMKLIGMCKFNMGALVLSLLTIQNVLNILATNFEDWKEQERGKLCLNRDV